MPPPTHPDLFFVVPKNDNKLVYNIRTQSVNPDEEIFGLSLSDLQYRELYSTKTKVGQSGIWVWVGENGCGIPPLVLSGLELS